MHFEMGHFMQSANFNGRCKNDNIIFSRNILFCVSYFCSEIDCGNT